MKKLKIVEDYLREEYYGLRRELIKMMTSLETQIRWYLRDIIFNLKKHERIEIKTRIKDCESAIGTLKKDIEFNTFENDPNKYKLTNLKDLVGIQIRVFPRHLILDVNTILIDKFPSWLSNHTYSEDKTDILAHKYYGLIDNINNNVRCEIQIVPMLVGLFWEVEHFAYYKPYPELINIKKNLEMQQIVQEIGNKFKEFDEVFERILLEEAKI